MIGISELAALAELYDRYANALDPQSPDRERAKLQFLARIEMLYEQEGAGIDFRAFRLEMVRRCKEYLKKNQPSP